MYLEELKKTVDLLNKYNFGSQSDFLISTGLIPRSLLRTISLLIPRSLLRGRSFHKRDDIRMALFNYCRQIISDNESLQYSRKTDLDISAYETIIIDSNRPHGSVYVTVVCGYDDSPSYLEDICASLNGYLPPDDQFTAIMKRVHRDSRPDGFETTYGDENESWTYSAQRAFDHELEVD